jgi:hypothetical protein
MTSPFHPEEVTDQAKLQIARIHIEYPGGDVYDGWWDVENEVPNGRGTYTWQSGGVYTGTWLGGTKHGYGTQIYPNGDIYDGGWMGNKWHGYGELTTSSERRIYHGGFVAFQENGYAEIQDEMDKSIYTGGVRQGQKHGYGELIKPTMIYKGGFQFDEKSGWGEDVEHGRFSYTGTFRDGKLWGIGRMEEGAIGKTREGIWENNEYKGRFRSKIWNI